MVSSQTDLEQFLQTSKFGFFTCKLTALWEDIRLLEHISAQSFGRRLFFGSCHNKIQFASIFSSTDWEIGLITVCSIQVFSMFLPRQTPSLRFLGKGAARRTGNDIPAVLFLSCHMCTFHLQGFVYLLVWFYLDSHEDISLCTCQATLALVNLDHQLNLLWWEPLLEYLVDTE